MVETIGLFSAGCSAGNNSEAPFAALSAAKETASSVTIDRRRPQYREGLIPTLPRSAIQLDYEKGKRR